MVTELIIYQFTNRVMFSRVSGKRSRVILNQN